MDKPLSMRRVETLEALSKIINEAGLPPFVIVDILNNLLTAMQQVAEDAYLREVKMYEEAKAKEQADADVPNKTE
ncbi:MAG TPA: hypothetical protein DCG33_01305 [Prevotellaceae bacterium]|nr:hypothetical protein [Prevotellaceae bacterium]